jgi:DNA-binding winged helix-turn-helix (wHTH) protein/Tol biopolymer transport system component
LAGDVFPARIVKFADFEADLSNGLLRKAGLEIRIQAKPLEVLRLLVTAPGRTVTREELRVALWPDNTFVDFEHGLNTAVKKLRKALEDSAEHPKLIQTIPKVGYRFIGAVELVPDGSFAQPNHQKVRISWRGIVLSGSLLIIAAFTIPHEYLRRPPDRVPPVLRALQERQLTANPEDTPVTSGAISPDGKLLVYSDPTGLYTKQIDTGETHPIPVPEGFDPLVESWFPDGGDLLVSWAEHPHLQPGLWAISVFGGHPRRIAREGYSASVSPDGSHIAFVKQARSVKQAGLSEELWLMRSDGGEERKLIGSVEDSFSRPAWAPDSTRFAYARTKTRYYANRRAPDTLIEIFDIRSERSLVVQDGGKRGLPRGGAGLAWLSDGRLIFPLREPRPNQQDTNLWSLRFDTQTLLPQGPTAQLTHGKGIAVQLSSSKDGKRIALRRHAPQPDIYIADLERGSNRLGTFRRLTLDERVDYAMDWTSDSRAVIFYSNRNGPFHIFKQAIVATQPELLVGGRDDLYAPRLTPDGSSVIYIIRPQAGGPSNNSRVMRVPLAGGVPQCLLETPGLFDLECTRPPAKFCFYGQIEDGRARLFTFDPTSGKAAELSEIESKLDSFNWILSHDGEHLAWPSEHLNGKQFGVRVFSRAGKLKRDIAVPGWSEIYGLDWAADSKSLWACTRDANGDSALLNVGLDGKTTTLLSHRYLSLEWTIPSPDGRHLAVVQNSNKSNISLLDF